MRTEIDMDAATDFAIALGHMIFARSEDPGPPNPRPMMVTCAAAGEEHGFEQASIEAGMDVVCLAFEPGREREGPVNASIVEERNGVLTTWPNCSPWAFSLTGPCLLVADGRDVGFAYNGEAIQMVWNVPREQTAERVEAGRTLLRLMTQCLPEDVLERRMALDPAGSRNARGDGPRHDRPPFKRRPRRR